MLDFLLPDRVQTCMPDPLEQKSFRGPLRYEIDTSAPQLEAGKLFSIFVRISNPYDVPVTILRVNTLLPAEFKEITEQDQVSKLAKAGFRLASFRETVAEFLKPGQFAPQDITATSIAPTNIAPAAPGGKNPQQSVELEPGNTDLKRFTIKTRGELFFLPAAYALNVQIEYQIDGKLSRDAVKQPFNVRAPLSALIWGAIPGSIVGRALNILINNSPAEVSDIYNLKVVASFFVAIMVATVLIIAFARKKDVQPFISIEDFWGGFFVGFLAGYVGGSLLNQVLPQTGAGSIAPHPSPAPTH